MPTVSPVAEPNVPIVGFAHDVVLVAASVFVRAQVPVGGYAAIGMNVGASIDVRRSMAPTVVPTTVVPSAVVPSTVTARVASAVSFGVCRRHHPKAERRSER